MWRIVSLVLGFGASCLLVGGLLGLTAEFADDLATEPPGQIPLLSVQTEPQSGETSLTLPAPVPGTGLIVEQLVSYEGPFIEDGSDTPVFNTAALVIRNGGQVGIEEASVVVERAGEQYVFNLTYILPGMSVMVLEQTAAPYFRDGISHIGGWERKMEESFTDSQDLQLAPLDMGSLAVTNLTADTMENITFYHKNYLPDGIFIGGITYRTFLGKLEPGQTETIFPDHYADGYSKIYYAEYR